MTPGKVPVGREDDYVKDHEAIVRDMTVDKVRGLASEYLNPDKMFWLVIGDEKSK